MKNKIRILCIITIFMLSICFLIYGVYANDTTTPAEETAIDVDYVYNDQTNTVIANVKSNNPFAEVKDRWTLSQDKLTYSYEFDANTNYISTFTDIYGNKFDVQIEVTDVIETWIEPTITYKKSEERNTVTAYIHSPTKFLNNKSSAWTLSEDQRTYSHEFDANTNYLSTFTDIHGNSRTLNIFIDDIEERNLELNIKYQSTGNNSVIATVTSNNILKANKSSWTLSEDKMSYSFEFKVNSAYTSTFTDIWGNTKGVDINITELDQTGPSLTISYVNNGNNTVTATVTSNEELMADKTSWKLSEDKLSYVYTFTENSNYTSTFKDKWGNPTSIHILITEIDKEPPKTSIQYIHNDDDSVTVNLIANEPLKESKSNWTLSADKKTYSHTFTDEFDYVTKVEDLYGNVDNCHIKAKKRINTYLGTPTIKVKYMYTGYENVVVELVSDVKLKNNKEPSWKLSADGYRYTKEFTQYYDYVTAVEDINGNKKTIQILIDYFRKIIKCEEGNYGVSGLLNVGDPRGSYLRYYKIGDGPNVFFATFSVHGWEDLYAYDGQALTAIAEDFKNRLIEMQDLDLDRKWTIYIFPSVNPDGEYHGRSHNGPGRTTLYSDAPNNRGIDLNRSWQIGSSYTRYTSDRNYNGTSGFQAIEARALRDFLVSHRATNGQTVLVDLHGWLNETLGDNGIGSYYRAQFGIGYHNPNYGTGYLINWARSTIGARSTLVELPEYDANSTKYINATLNMLRSI